MSDSQFVCWKDGIPVTTSRGAWRHALGGRTGAIPPHRRHRPVVIERAEYDRAFHPDTPLAEARAIAERMRAAETAQATAGAQHLIQLVLRDRPYTAAERREIAAWLRVMTDREEALRAAIAADTPAHHLAEVVVTDSTTNYTPVTRYAVVPDAARSYIGYVQQSGSQWRGFAYDSRPETGKLRPTQAEAVIDAFTDHLLGRI